MSIKFDGVFDRHNFNVIMPAFTICTGFAMKKNRLIINTIFALVYAIFLNASAFAEPANLSLLKKEVQVYHDSGIYQKELANVITYAELFIIKSANANAHSAHPKKLTIVLDIDETSLSNYDNLVAREFGGSHAQIHKEILAGQLSAVAPMRTLYDVALKHGVSVFFVTGRIEAEREATIKNLENTGYHDWTGLYLKPNNYSEASNIPFKSKTRAEISKKGYTIIASIGDQYSDLKGGYAEKTFKLPNPYYYIP